jgi:hypothetical protein
MYFLKSLKCVVSCDWSLCCKSKQVRHFPRSGYQLSMTCCRDVAVSDPNSSFGGPCFEFLPGGRPFDRGFKVLRQTLQTEETELLKCP